MKNLILTQYNSMQEKGYKFNKNYFLQFYLFIYFFKKYNEYMIENNIETLQYEF